MHLDMFVEVCSLSETKSTVFKVANIGFFTCVNSKVIKEVVPLSEVFTTVLVITFEYLNKSFRFRILKSKDSK